MTNNRGGRRDNAKRRPDDARGGARAGSGRPAADGPVEHIRLDPTTAQRLWELRQIARGFGLATSAAGYLALMVERQYREDVDPTLPLSEAAQALTDDEDKEGSAP